MATVGGSFARILAQLEAGETRAEIGFKIHSRDLRRFVERLGGKIDNMQESFQILGQKIQDTFFGHFQNEQGPDPLNSDVMIDWPDYNMPDDPLQMSYKEKKEQAGYGDKLMQRTGALMESIMNPGNVKASKNRLEISTDVGYGIYGHTGFTGRNGKPTPEETRRPIVGLTDDEESDLIAEMMDEFWNEVDR